VLLRFRIENFRALRDEQEVSFIAADLSEPQAETFRVESLGSDVLPVVAIYGANASGKSSVLMALDFLCTAVRESHRSWPPDGGVPREPFLLDGTSRDKPSLFEIDFMLDSTRYQYGFVVDSQRVVEEWLSAYPRGKKQAWFVRDAAHDPEIRFSRSLGGENEAIRRLTRANSLFLSAAAQNNHPRLTPVYNWLAHGVLFASSEDRDELLVRAANVSQRPEFRDAMLALLRASDLGISDVALERESAHTAIVRFTAERDRSDLRSMDTIERDHLLSRLSLVHEAVGGSGVGLPFRAESAGTRALFALAGAIVQAIASGVVLCIDEIDSSLHPLLVLEVIKLFQSRTTNPKRAQLLFNTHDTNILDSGVLRRDQLWFTEKDATGASHVYPLTDYRPRKQENIKRGYLQGRYGAVPFLQGVGAVASALAHASTE
jgi:AAA15 family ATPase/GTPase